MLSGKFKFIFLSLCFCFFSCCAKKNEEKKEIVSGDYIENFRLKQTKDGEVIWELKARGAKFLSEDIIELADVEVKFFSEGKKSTITATSGRINQKTSDIETFGPTTLKSKDKTIYTSDVRFNNSENKIHTNKNVEIITKDARIKGSSMISDSTMESIVLTDQTVTWKK